MSLDELHQQIFNCEECALSKERCTVVVKRGSNTSPLMIIGEAPGEQEDLSGIPFIGDSGALLERIFQGVGIDSKNVYITNIVKCRPPNNRKPSSEEIKACKPWLLDQIAKVNPYVLVLLGATAYTGLIGNKWVDKTPFGITKHRGQWFESDYCQNTIATFHPSYCLHNWKLDEGSPKYLVWKDWVSISEKLGELI